MNASEGDSQVEDVEDDDDLGYHEEFQGLYIVQHKRHSRMTIE